MSTCSRGCGGTLTGRLIDSVDCDFLLVKADRESPRAEIDPDDAREEAAARYEPPGSAGIAKRRGKSAVPIRFLGREACEDNLINVIFSL